MQTLIMSDRLEKLTNDEWPEDQTLNAEWRRKGLSGQSWKNCYAQWGKSWQVRMFLGGEQRLLAQVSAEHGCRATQFADMAILYFHPYRKRRVRPVVDSDLNFSVELAKSNLAKYPAAKQILVDFEQALLKANLIEPTVYKGAEGDKLSVAQIRRDLQVCWNQYQTAFSRANHVLSTNPDNTVVLSMMMEHFGHTVKFNASIDRLLSALEQPEQNQ